MSSLLVIIKPDAVEREGVFEQICEMIDNSNFETSPWLDFGPPETDLLFRQHYFDKAEKPYFEAMISAYTRGHVIVGMISRVGLEGADLVAAGLVLRDAVRARFGVDFRNNSIHVSDSVEEAAREIDVWFS